MDEFELILLHLKDDMIQINVVLQASFNEPSPKILLKEMCLFLFQSPPGDSSYPKIIESACCTKIGMALLGHNLVDGFVLINLPRRK